MLKKLCTSAAITFLFLIQVSLITQSCSRESSQAEAALVEYLKARGVKEVEVDLFTDAKNNGNKAYISATLTHQFATAEGTPQKEYMGYILSKTDGKWVVERSERYTKDKDQAIRYLSGSK